LIWGWILKIDFVYSGMIMKENTLQDVADQIAEVVEALGYFIESEELDVVDLMNRLEEIKAEIEETLD